MSSVLTCIRSLRIIYQHVGGRWTIFDIPKSTTRFTLRGQQCTMGCAIIIRSVDVNGSVTTINTACTTSGRTQIFFHFLFYFIYYIIQHDKILIGVFLQKHESTQVVLKTTKRRQRCNIIVIGRPFHKLSRGNIIIMNLLKHDVWTWRQSETLF